MFLAMGYHGAIDNGQKESSMAKFKPCRKDQPHPLPLCLEDDVPVLITTLF